MQQIKFKAITTDRKWVEGDVIHLDERTMIAGCEMSAYDKGDAHENITIECIEVIPETVCVFTGLHDKNGKEIYSGDTFNYKGQIRCVEYVEDRCRYVLTTGKGYDSRNCVDLDCDVIFGLETTGNTFDPCKTVIWKRKIMK